MSTSCKAFSFLEVLTSLGIVAVILSSLLLWFGTELKHTQSLRNHAYLMNHIGHIQAHKALPKDIEYHQSGNTVTLKLHNTNDIIEFTHIPLTSSKLPNEK